MKKLLLAGYLLAFGGPSSAATFIVTNLNDSLPGSLRVAIATANTSPAGPHRVTFNLPSPFTLLLTNALPPVTTNVTIDGTTQPGYAGTPVVRLVAGTGAVTPGLELAGQGGVVRGLRIEKFIAGPGIHITGPSNRVEACHLCTNLQGVLVSAAGSFSVIGGTAASNRNVIGGNGGVGVALMAASGRCLVQGNYIGPAAGGTEPFAATNNVYGVQIEASPFNTVGGTSAGARNVIAGNSSYGVVLSGGAVGNSVAGNFIGVDAGGVTALANGSAGVWVDDASSNYIGGVTIDSRNTISGNRFQGVVLGGTNCTGCAVGYNLIGVGTNGLPVPNGQAGVFVQAGGQVIHGNIISGNGGVGVDLDGAGARDNELYGNAIGLRPDGFTLCSNNAYGVRIRNGASSNRVGRVGAFANIISCNGLAGVLVSGTGCVGNLVINNVVGMDAFGEYALGAQRDGIQIVESRETRVGDSALGAASVNYVAGNTTAGVELYGGLSNSVECNLIGLTASGTSAAGSVQAIGISVRGGRGHRIGPGRNVVSGNGSRGVSIGEAAEAIQVISNFIGCATNGVGRVPNGVGVYFTQCAGLTVRGNVISGNDGHGIEGWQPNALEVRIEGNRIGTDHTGGLMVSNNGVGVHLNGVPSALIGGTQAVARNVISGNGSHGVSLLGGGVTTGLVVAGNFIGLAVSGIAVLGNGGDGVNGNVIQGVQIGGPGDAWGNVIAGNDVGIRLSSSHDCLIAHNDVGVEATGSAARSNRTAGIALQQGTWATVVEQNPISGNQGPGVLLTDNARLNVIRGNIIGCASAGPMVPLPNQGPGILSIECESNRYGGLIAVEANRIAFNGGAGIAITNQPFVARFGHEVYGNLIYSNGGPGIDLNDDGVSTNDPAPDADAGLANDLQNFPVLSLALQGSTVVQGYLVSAPVNNPYRLEFFALVATQGMVFIGATDLYLGVDGTGTFTCTFGASPPVGSIILATASTTNRGTSEFSAPIVMAGPSSDSDLDFMPDWWEVTYGLNPAVSNAPGADADGDGFSDLAEWIADTVPNAVESGFRVTSIRDGSGMRIGLPSSATRLYALEASVTVEGGVWTQILTGISGNGGSLELIDRRLVRQRSTGLGCECPEVWAGAAVIRDLQTPGIERRVKASDAGVIQW